VQRTNPAVVVIFSRFATAICHGSCCKCHGRNFSLRNFSLRWI